MKSTLIALIDQPPFSTTQLTETSYIEVTWRGFFLGVARMLLTSA